MNCECVYYNPGAIYEDYEALADKIACDAYELYPTSIIRVDEPMLVRQDRNEPDGWTYIPGQRFCLLVWGKLAHMRFEQYANGKAFTAYFPEWNSIPEGSCSDITIFE